MSPEHLPCVRALDRECFRAHPEFARRALAYRLLHLLIPPDIARLLPKKLSDPLVAPGVEVPLGAVFPPGTVLVPGCSFPVGWDPEDEPPECAKSAPLPTLAMQIAGGNPSVILSPGEPGTGQVHPPAGPPPVEHGSGNYRPMVSGDDGRWTPGGFFTSSQALLQLGISGATLYHIYLTLNGIEAAQGAKIVTAELFLTEGGGGDIAGIDTTIYANNVDSPTNPTSAAEADALALTTNTVTWNFDKTVQFTTYRTGEIKAVIQEVVDRSGWEAGNNLMLVIKAHVTSAAIVYPMAIESAQPALRADLYVEW